MVVWKIANEKQSKQLSIPYSEFIPEKEFVFDVKIEGKKFTIKSLFNFILKKALLKQVDQLFCRKPQIKTLLFNIIWKDQFIQSSILLT